MAIRDDTATATATALASRRRLAMPAEGPLRTAVMAGSGLLLVLMLWEAVCWLFAVPIYLVPSPLDVMTAFRADLRLLALNAVPTVTEAAVGFVLGNVVAILVAIAFVYNKLIEEMFYPVAILIKTIPIVAIASILTASGIAIAGFALVSVIETRVIRWNPGESY